MDTTKKLPEELIAKLKAPLPAEAIGRHPTRTYLSSIKAIFVVERLNEVFGVDGWKQKLKEIVRVTEGGISKKGDPTPPMVVVLTTLAIPEYGIEHEAFGGNDNEDLGDAFKGAMTDSLTKMASYIYIGMDVYKGLGNAPAVASRAKKLPTIQCDECKKDVLPFRKPNGTISSVEQIVNASIAKHKKTLCAKCQLDIAAIEKQERQPTKEVQEPGGQTIMVAEVQDTTKGYLKVKYHAPGSMGELDASLWDKKLWPLFELPAGKKFVVKIESKTSKGRTYNNIVDVLKVGEYFVENGELVIQRLGITDEDVKAIA